MLSANDEERIRKLESRILSLESASGAETRPTPAKWYDNIPDSGVLCWLGTGEVKSLTSETYFAGAIPLTKQEIQKFHDNAPENNNAH